MTTPQQTYKEFAERLSRHSGDIVVYLPGEAPFVDQVSDAVRPDFGGPVSKTWDGDGNEVYEVRLKDRPYIVPVSMVEIVPQGLDCDLAAGNSRRTHYHASMYCPRCV